MSQNSTNIRNWSALMIFVFSGTLAQAATTPQKTSSQRVPAKAPSSAAKSVRSPFQACQSVTIYEHEQRSKGIKPSGNVQIMPKIGFWSNGQIGPADRQQALELTRAVAGQYRKNLQTNLRYLEQLRTCFTGKPITGCKKNRAIVERMLETLPSELRVELALSRPRIGGSDDISLGFDDPKFAINRYLKDFSSYVNNPVGENELTPEEFEKVKAQFLAERTRIRAAVDKALKDRREKRGETARDDLYNGANHVGVMLSKKEWNSMRERHQTRYRELIYRTAPIFAYLPKAEWRDGKPAWTDEQVRGSIDKLIENAREEIAITDKSLKTDKLEFDRFYTEKRAGNRVYSELNLERFHKGMLKGERDLLDYIVFSPVVEEVLRQQGRYCAMATGLMEHFNNKEGQDALWTLGILLPAIPVAGMALGAGGAVATAGAVTLTAAEASAVIGIGLGVGFFAESYRDLKVVRRQVLTKSGAGGETERETQDYQRIAEAESNVTINAATMVFNVGDGLILGRYLAQAAKNGLLSPAVKNLLTSAKATERDQALAVYRSMLGILGKDKAGAEEMKLWAELSAKFGFDGATATPELHDRWLLATRTFFSRELRSAADFERVRLAKGIFDRLRPQVIGSWTKEEYDGMLRFFDHVMNELGKAPEAELIALRRGSGEVQDQILDRALARSGISSEAERKLMIRCPFGKTG